MDAKGTFYSTVWGKLMRGLGTGPNSAVTKNLVLEPRQWIDREDVRKTIDSLLNK